ncbi:MAG: hypothetical protein ACD_79C00643G0006 [uncultured bacterium]|nr:MAG: hypothetical protein ACD_79C00643G0006 [uncultured bacterium]
MCGICGFVTFQNENIAENIYPMMDALKKRGPDDCGVFFDKKVTLGHRRLSVIDISTGHQPIFNEDRTIVLIQNGEFYNFLDLRNELKTKGHVFKTNSDAEVFIHLYEEKGFEAISSITGMYAFALYDIKKQLVFLCRDRLGQKPVFYSHNTSGIIFGSELKSLLPHPFIQNTLNKDSMLKYFFYDYIPNEDTIYQNIFKILPGNFLQINLKNNTVSKKCYWEIPLFNSNYQTSSLEENSAKLSEHIDESVLKMLKSDVPLGILLSGGLDSSVITYSMRKQIPKELLHTFSIGFNENHYDETFYSSLISKYLQTQHHHYYLSEEQAKITLKKVKEYIDEPFADPSIIPTYYLSENTKQFVTVALSGDGGDELFGGYQIFNLLNLLSLFNKSQRTIKFIYPIIKSFISFSDKYNSSSYFIEKFYNSLFINNYHTQLMYLFGSFSPKEIAELLGIKSTDVEQKISKDIEYYTSLRKGEDNIAILQYLLTKLYLGEGVLTKVDRASMANSLEVRSPFLDHHLFELVFSKIPSNQKVNRKQTKYILKKTYEGMLPNEIIYRMKKGFAMPISKWIRTVFKDEILRVLDNSILKQQGLLNHEYITRILDEHMKGIKNHRKKIWSLFMFQYWMENNRNYSKFSS